MAESPNALPNVEAIITTLEADPDWRKLGATGVTRDIKSFVRDFEKLQERTRRCEDIPERVEELMRIISRAHKVGEGIWDTFEFLGAWTDRSQPLIDKIEATLEPKVLIEAFVEDLLLGCQCRKQ